MTIVFVQVAFELELIREVNTGNIPFTTSSKREGQYILKFNCFIMFLQLFTGKFYVSDVQLFAEDLKLTAKYLAYCICIELLTNLYTINCPAVYRDHPVYYSHWTLLFLRIFREVQLCNGCPGEGRSIVLQCKTLFYIVLPICLVHWLIAYS